MLPRGARGRRWTSTLASPSQASSLKALIAERFPPHTFAFGYGSGVLPQSAASSSDDRQIDVVLSVPDARAFHRANLARNPSDYPGWVSPSLPWSAGLVTRLQRGFGGKAWFHPYVPVSLEGRPAQLKYGVVQDEDLLEDLEDWSSLYVAGRLQKPVVHLGFHDFGNPNLTAVFMLALHQNRERALAAALLRFPPDERRARFAVPATRSESESELFMKIAGLSYLGDVRMGIAESPSKLRDLVSQPQAREGYRALYLRDPTLAPLFGASTRELWARLPARLAPPESSEEESCVKDIESALAPIVKRSSASQTLKGLLSAGAGKSLAYAARKLRKRFGG